MSVSEFTEHDRWTIAEVWLIYCAARRQGFLTGLISIYNSIETWRMWYYGFTPYVEMLFLKGVSHVNWQSR